MKNVFVGFADATYEKNGYLVVEATVERENIDCNKQHLNWLLRTTWGKEYGVRRAMRKAPEDNGSWITVKFFTNLPYGEYQALSE